MWAILGHGAVTLASDAGIFAALAVVVALPLTLGIFAQQAPSVLVEVHVSVWACWHFRISQIPN